MEVRMPKMGDGMEEGTILRWIKHEGDSVQAEEPIAEIETDKANVEMPAEEGGTLSRIVVQEGQTVPVGAVIAYIGEAGAAVQAPAAARPQTNGAQQEKQAPSPAAPAESVTSPPPSAPSYGARQEAAPAPEPGPAPSEERVKVSPLARKMAAEMGIDLARVAGTGPGGRVVERDITAFQARPQAAPAAAPARTATAPAAPSLEGEDRDLTKMRKAIARRTVLSKQTIPHIYLTIGIDMDAAVSMLEQMNASTPDHKVTVNDAILKACAAALVKLPDVNVSFTPEEKIRHYAQINIAVAMGTEEGLWMPVIRDCGHKTLRQISADANEFKFRVRSGGITPQEMSGATFSVSNLGMFGIEEFAAIISPPESAILAVGAIAPEVVTGEDGGFAVRKRMRVTLSCDHRAVDGLLGARFLQELRRLLQNPFELLA